MCKKGFTKDDGGIYNTIILAGENGTGKTTILDTISEFLNLGAVTPFDYMNSIKDGMVVVTPPAFCYVCCTHLTIFCKVLHFICRNDRYIKNIMSFAHCFHQIHIGDCS